MTNFLFQNREAINLFCHFVFYLAGSFAVRALIADLRALFNASVAIARMVRK